MSKNKKRATLVQQILQVDDGVEGMWGRDGQRGKDNG